VNGNRETRRGILEEIGRRGKKDVTVGIQNV
jgi:hypothetical protein